MGSERTVTDSSQTVTGTITVEGFGQTIATTGSSANPYMFAATSGYRNDNDAGLMLVGARYYDAQVGRFITRDAYLDQKPYLYCEHDPINHLDPSGHQEAPNPAVVQEGVTLAALASSVLGVLGAITVAAAVGEVIESSTPPGTLAHKIGATAAGVGITTVGLGVVAFGATLVAAPIVITSVVIGGVGLAAFGVFHAMASWFEKR